MFIFQENATNQNDVVKFGPVCKFHLNRISDADKRNRRIQKMTPKRRAKACWMNPVEVGSHDDENTDDFNTLTESNERICIR